MPVAPEAAEAEAVPDDSELRRRVTWSPPLYVMVWPKTKPSAVEQASLYIYIYIYICVYIAVIEIIIFSVF